MQGFIHRKNLEHYRKLLAGPTLDEDTHRVVSKLCLTRRRRSRLYPKPGATTNSATLPIRPSLTLRPGGGTVELS
jgi:hypothetical protein